MYAFDKKVMSDDNKTLGIFTSSWAACAAMIRVKQPDFKSLGGDSVADLREEQAMKLLIARMK